MHFTFNAFFFWQPFPLWDSVDRLWCSLTGTDDIIIRRMYSACWITKATDTHSEYVTLLNFHNNNGYTKAPQCYVTRMLPVLSVHYLSRAHVRSNYIATRLVEGNFFSGMQQTGCKSDLLLLSSSELYLHSVIRICIIKWKWSLQPLLYIFFFTGGAHLPKHDRSETLDPQHRKGNIHHIYRDSTCTPPLCAPD